LTNVKFSLAILTGGKSKRFGANKCNYKIDGKMMIERVLDSIAYLFEDVLFSGSDPRVELENGKVIEDIHPNKGPVAGLESALMYAKNDYVFLVACDMPFISPEVIKFMMEMVEGQNILCPQVDGKYQTTHAIYSKSILPLVKKELERDKSTLTHVVLTSTNVKILKEEFFSELQNYKMSFRNFNSPEELKTLTKKIQHF
jgi:molybdopterin-guanine dinucleotide biosynthesis protein A